MSLCVIPVKEGMTSKKGIPCYTLTTLHILQNDKLKIRLVHIRQQKSLTILQGFQLLSSLKPFRISYLFDEIPVSKQEFVIYAMLYLLWPLVLLP